MLNESTIQGNREAERKMDREEGRHLAQTGGGLG